MKEIAHLGHPQLCAFSLAISAQSSSSGSSPKKWSKTPDMKSFSRSMGHLLSWAGHRYFNPVEDA